MVLSLMDTMRTAVATRNEKVLLSLAELIGTVDTPYQDFPLEQLIDAIVEMSTQPRRVKQIPCARRTDRPAWNLLMHSKWQFFMDALSRSERQTEKHVEKRHVPLLAILGIVILLALLLGGIPAAIHYHEYTGVVVGVMLGIVAVGAFAYWIAFAGYYAIYCEEAKKAETAIAERDQAIAKEKGLREEIANEKQQEALRLKVSRLIQDGERLLQEYDAAVRSGGAAVLRPCADIGPWHREVIGLAKNEMVEHWLHFNDFQELVPENAARAKMPYREQVAGLIRRLTDVLGMFMVSPFRLGRFE